MQMVLIRKFNRQISLSESDIRACSVAHITEVMDTKENKKVYNWFKNTFDKVAGKRTPKASTAELATFLIAFGQAQQAKAQNRSGGLPDVLVRNLQGMESVCAALVVMFGAEIHIGDRLRKTTHRPFKPTRVKFEFDDGRPRIGARHPAAHSQ